MNAELYNYIPKDVVDHIIIDYLMISKKEVELNKKFLHMQLECVIGTTSRRTFSFLRFIRLCNYSPFEQLNLIIA